jgi:hypothetical protein
MPRNPRFPPRCDPSCYRDLGVRRSVRTMGAAMHSQIIPKAWARCRIKPPDVARKEPRTFTEQRRKNHSANWTDLLMCPLCRWTALPLQPGLGTEIGSITRPRPRYCKGKGALGRGRSAMYRGRLQRARRNLAHVSQVPDRAVYDLSGLNGVCFTSVFPARNRLPAGPPLAGGRSALPFSRMDVPAGKSSGPAPSNHPPTLSAKPQREAAVDS